MKGHYVERRFGWDTHGVHIEYDLEEARHQGQDRAATTRNREIQRGMSSHRNEICGGVDIRDPENLGVEKAFESQAEAIVKVLRKLSRHDPTATPVKDDDELIMEEQQELRSAVFMLRLLRLEVVVGKIDGRIMRIMGRLMNLPS